MTVEIERRFLVDAKAWLISRLFYARNPTRIEQWVLFRNDRGIVRLRVSTLPTGDKKAELTVKGPASVDGLERVEVNCPLSLPEAEALQKAFPGTPLVKDRFPVTLDEGLEWEINVFHGSNEGLVIAEIEFTSVDSAREHLPRPSWIGEEVTEDPRYLSAMLEVQPYKSF